MTTMRFGHTPIARKNDRFSGRQPPRMSFKTYCGDSFAMEDKDGEGEPVGDQADTGKAARCHGEIAEVSTLGAHRACKNDVKSQRQRLQASWVAFEHILSKYKSLSFSVAGQCTYIRCSKMTEFVYS